VAQKNETTLMLLIYYSKMTFIECIYNNKQKKSHQLQKKKNGTVQSGLHPGSTPGLNWGV
jgi:hypothetical protein